MMVFGMFFLSVIALLRVLGSFFRRDCVHMHFKMIFFYDDCAITDKKIIPKSRLQPLGTSKLAGFAKKGQKNR